MGGSKSSSGDEVKVTQYAPYIEDRHISFLDTVTTNREIMLQVAPLSGYSNLDATAAFLGNGIVLFGVYDLFGKLLIDLDIDAIWDKCFTKVMSRSEPGIQLTEEMKQIDEHMVNETIAGFQVDMRNINAVTTSSFIVGRAVIENERVKKLMHISLTMKEHLLPLVNAAFIDKLNMRRDIFKRYTEIIKGYLIWKEDTDSANYNAATSNSLWPFTVLSFEGAALGVMQSSFGWRKQMDARERSNLSRGLSVASYTVTGGYIGSSITPGIGTVIGAVVGFVVGVALMLFE